MSENEGQLANLQDQLAKLESLRSVLGDRVTDLKLLVANWRQVAYLYRFDARQWRCLFAQGDDKPAEEIRITFDLDIDAAGMVQHPPG